MELIVAVLRTILLGSKAELVAGCRQIPTLGCSVETISGVIEV